MNIISPDVTIYREGDNLKKIEMICRICTDSQDKVGSDPSFLQKRWREGHGSVFEHLRVAIPENEAFPYIMQEDVTLPYGALERIEWNDNACFINGRDFLALGGTLEELNKHPQDPLYITARFVVDIGIARELIRHRQMSFTEKSTRYCKFDSGVDFILPIPNEWAEMWQNRIHTSAFQAWQSGCSCAENAYRKMRELGYPPQEARNVLPLSTATVLYMSGTIKQWQEVIALRTARGAHPQMKYIMKKMEGLLK